jgi:hypothetical protein
MMPGMVEKRIQAKLEGEVLKWGRCICGQCGKKGKMGTSTKATPQKPVVRILCVDCTVADLVQRHNISPKEAKDRHEKTMKAQERLIRVTWRNMRARKEILIRASSGSSSPAKWWKRVLRNGSRSLLQGRSKETLPQSRSSPPPDAHLNDAPDIGR